MTRSSMIAIDTRQVEHLDLPRGFLPLVVGTALRHYGEQVCMIEDAVNRPFFLAAYFLPTSTIYTSALVDPEQLAEELHDHAIEFGRDKPLVDGTGFVVSATLTNELVAEPGYVGFRTHVVLDSHFEGDKTLKRLRA